MPQQFFSCLSPVNILFMFDSEAYLNIQPNFTQEIIEDQ